MYKFLINFIFFLDDSYFLLNIWNNLSVLLYVCYMYVFSHSTQVLITKLRSATNVETQQYRKAAKALLVLIPLLGVTYILVIVGPTHGISRRIYDNLRAVLLSTQVCVVFGNRSQLDRRF